MALSGEQVREIAEAVVEQYNNQYKRRYWRKAEIKEISSPDEGKSNEIFEIELTTSKSLMVRVKKAEHFQSRMQAIIDYIKKRRFRFGFNKDDIQVFVTKKIKGVSLKTALDEKKEHYMDLTRDETKTIIKEAIKAAKKMTKKKVKGFGWLNREVKGVYKTEKQEFQRVLEKKIPNLVTKGVINQSMADKITELIDKYLHLFNYKEPRFIYTDLNFGNIIVNFKKRKFKGLIDYDYVVGGDPVRIFVIFSYYTFKPEYKELAEEIIKEELTNKQIKKLRILFILEILSNINRFIEGIIKRDDEYLSDRLGRIKKLIDDDYEFCGTKV